MSARFDHIDLSVPDLAAVIPFYRGLLPALGFIREVKIEDWFQLETEDGSEFFGITKDPGYRCNATRIAFRAASDSEVDTLAQRLISKDRCLKHRDTTPCSSKTRSAIDWKLSIARNFSPQNHTQSG